MTAGVLGDREVDEKVQEWLSWDKNESTRQEILDLVAENNVEVLRQRLLGRMAFGTAGLRAPMGAGYSRMNDLTVIQTAQGLLSYLESTCPELKQSGIVIGYDHRYNSRRFAELTAAIFLHRGVRVRLFSNITPTPFVPYGVVRYKAALGVMVTPSHNPKEDNGYKVYWSNGPQIIPPHDAAISAQILAHLEPWQTSWETDPVTSSPLCSDPLPEVNAAYFQDIGKLSRHRSINAAASLPITYTAMHGVGALFVSQAFQQFGLQPYIPVPEQVEPDPDFPTVKFPNPEEGKSALKLAMRTAEGRGSRLIIANDPDADRCALAEKQPGPHGRWKVFDGNQMGALYGWWALEQARGEGEGALSDTYMLASTVSSKILATMAAAEGFHFQETLTGFKWMGNQADQLIRSGKRVIFAFEEAIGFMIGSQVLDKDGISAAAVLAEMACYLATKQCTLTQQLDNIYAKYGHHVSQNSYFICHDKQKIGQIFDRIRSLQDNSYPQACGPYRVTSVRDLTTGYDSQQPDKKAVLPVSRSSQMITMTFDTGVTATLRTSGTEPKVKYYTEIRTDPAAQGGQEQARAELAQCVQCVIDHLLQPQLNGLQPKED